MIEIDGSYGEGGGQIVRTSVALSAVTAIAIEIKNIRQNRPKPGLAPQHAHAIKALSRLCNARISGVKPGSSEIIFEPGYIKAGNNRVEIGTAGSVTLLMQCLLPAMLNADGPVSLEVHGGTDVQWSPTIDYFKHIFIPALRSFGIKANLDIWQRGYYPKGMGAVLLQIDPGRLKPAHLSPQGVRLVEGISHCSNLPEHVVKRQAETAVLLLERAGLESRVITEVLHLPSTGSGITLWSGYKGGSALGERGLRAEDVGEKAADNLIEELVSNAAIDKHLADQLIPYLALAGGSLTTSEISMHAKTNIWTAAHFTERKFEVSGEAIFKIEAN
ncbi:MAG: RNA 3'-terminal phosphate cyclase [Methanotrichaceae archaeon]|nr:RNA 3'-terminal phosphate cyclase [Methanotrichaceae archaeon]